MEYTKVIQCIFNTILFLLALTIGYAVYKGIACWHLYLIGAMIYTLKCAYINDND